MAGWGMGSHKWEMGYCTCEKGRNVGLGLIVIGVEGKKGQGVAVLLADGVGLIGEY